MKYLFLISISCFILCSCNKERETTPYQFANMTIEEIDDTDDDDFYGQIKLKQDTISFIFENYFVVKDSLKFVEGECEALHRTFMDPEVYVYVALSGFSPSDDHTSDVKVKRYRVSFDLIGICPKKFNAGVYFNGQTHILHYPN